MTQARAEDLRKLVDECDGKCGYCGCELPEGDGIGLVGSRNRVVSILQPLMKGGAWETSNMVIACNICETQKGTRTVEEYKLLLQKEMGAVFTPQQIAWLRSQGIEVPLPPEIKFHYEMVKATVNSEEA